LNEVAFDDLQILRSYVSEEFGDWSNEYEITQEMIDSFADLTTDKQWIHIDKERAKDGPFGTTIAHGFLVLSMMPAVRPPANFVVVGHKAVANFGSKGMRFLDPLPADSRIYARNRLQDVEQHRRGTLLTQEVAIHRVGSEKPTLLYQLQLLYLA
jgi:acyl dehydratase